MTQRRLTRLLFLAFVLLFAGLTVAWVPGPQTLGGTVLGEVVNGTPGGSVPEDLTVTLHAFSEMEETRAYTTTVTGEGSFRFEGVSYQEGQTVVARVLYAGVTYVSEFATIDQEQEALSLPVTIYETTNDPTDVRVSQLHLFVNQMGEVIQVGEYAVIANVGSRTYVGATDADIRTTWTARLPEGAENLQFDGAELGSRFVPVDGGFADTRPIPPGEASVETSFTYELPFREGIEIKQSFDVPVRAVVLVLPDGDWGLSGPSISAEGTLDTQMGAALSYTAGALGADQPLAFTIVPRTPSAPNTPETSSLNEVALGIVALVVAAVVVALVWRAPSPGPVPVEARAQIAAIAALDRQFENGTLPEHTYREKRYSLKQRLRQSLSG